MIRQIKIFLAKRGLWKPQAIDYGLGEGWVICPICKEKIYVSCPNVSATICYRCGVFLD